MQHLYFRPSTSLTCWYSSGILFVITSNYRIVYANVIMYQPVAHTCHATLCNSRVLFFIIHRNFLCSFPYNLQASYHCPLQRFIAKK